MSGTAQVIAIPFLRARVIVRNSKDFFAGLFFALTGCFFLGLAQSYSIGDASRMGPGFFPFGVGSILAGLGLIIAMRSLSAKAEWQPLPNWNWRSLAWVLGSTTVFGIILSRAGLVCSLVVLIVMASRASHEFSWRSTLVNSAVIVGISLVAFVWLLKVDIPTWPVFLGI